MAYKMDMCKTMCINLLQITLRHLSYTTEQRVCSLCLTFVDLLMKTQSSNVVSLFIANL